MRRRSTITIPKDRETIISEALKREEAVRLHRENEATILSGAPAVEPLPPRPYVRPEVNWVEVVLSAPKRLIAIMLP